MGSYRLYYLRAAELTGTELIEARDDFDAARIARGLAVDAIVEVWNGARKVRTLGPTGHRYSAEQSIS